MADVLIQPEDRRFYLEKPDLDFSPRRNKAIIEETMRNTDKFFQGLGRVVNESIREKFDMVSSYGVYRFNKGHKSFADYVGKDIIRQLAGERIASRVRIVDSSRRFI